MLSDILGHESTKQYLIGLHKGGTMHHAVVLYGPPKVGKFKLAKSLARMVNCQAHGHAACTCASCIKITGGHHPDVKMVEPNDKDNITLDVVRNELLQPFEFMVHEGAKKIGIIRRANKMITSAANAMLKVLEEPRGDTLFILTTNDYGGLLDTIRSRCHPVRLSFLPTSVLETLLQKDSQEADPIMIELMGGCYEPRAIQDSLPLFGKVFAGQHTVMSDNLEKDALENELLYLGGVFAYMQREKLHQFGKVVVPRANSVKLAHLFDSTDSALNFVRRGVKPYLAARWYDGKIREQLF